MSFAAVDIGNTAISLNIWDDNGNLQFKRHGAFRSIIDIIPFFSEVGVNSVAYSSTRDLTEEESSLVEANRWWKVTVESNLPVKIAYDTPHTLGLDRLMAATAVTRLFPGESVIVADAGTALTLDFVSADGIFKGGNISAGLSMRLRALHQFTSKLPRIDTLICAEGHTGRDTTTAIQYGAIWGVAYEIAGTLAYAVKNYGCRRLVVAGGDAPFMMQFITEAVKLLVEAPVEVVLKEDIVVYGLKTAYEYNHETN